MNGYLYLKRMSPGHRRLTLEEKERLEAAKQRIDGGEYVKDCDIEW